MGVTVLEDVAVKVSAGKLDVFDNVGVLEDVGRNLLCLIKPKTTAKTFGKESRGAKTTTPVKHNIYGVKFTSGSSGTLASLSLDLKYYQAGNIKCALYDSDLNLVANGTTEAKAFDAGMDGFQVFTFATPPSIAASSTYWLCWWADEYFYGYHDTGASGSRFSKATNYDGWPASISTPTYGPEQWPIYATYEGALSGPVELVSLAESIVMHPYSFIDVYDSVGVTDVDAVFLLTLFNLWVNDSPSVTESLEVDPVLIKAVVDDSSTVAELITSVASLADIDIYDSTNVTESLVRKLISFISEHEDVTLAEAVSTLTTIGDISVYDTITIFEKIYLDLWIQRIQEDDIEAWTERTKENETDAWIERTKETDTWTERTNKESN